MIATSFSLCGSPIRRSSRQRSRTKREAHRCRTRRCLGEKAAKHRLLVLRKSGAAAGRRVRRWRPYPAALRRECGFARDFRAQCGRQRVFAQFQHGCRRCHRASRGAPIHSPARQADRMHRQPGIQRQRSAVGIGYGHARGRAQSTRSRSMSPRNGRRIRCSGSAAPRPSIALCPSSRGSAAFLPSALMSVLGLGSLTWYYAST